MDTRTDRNSGQHTAGPLTRLKKRASRAIVLTPARAIFEPDFCITGTGRSGTTYISRLLRAVGLRCGHENWWTMSGNRSLRFLDGDASWVAAFELDGYKGQVFHQIRDPIRVVDALVNGEMTNRSRLSYEVRSRYVDYTGDEIHDALLSVVAWLRQSEAVSEWTWRLEDIDEGLLRRICDAIGHPIDEEEARHAIEAVPAMNSRTRPERHRRITWDELPDSKLTDEAMEIARLYGYL